MSKFHCGGEACEVSAYSLDECDCVCERCGGMEGERRLEKRRQDAEYDAHETMKKYVEADVAFTRNAFVAYREQQIAEEGIRLREIARDLGLSLSDLLAEIGRVR